jgi:hypothetical protein
MAESYKVLGQSSPSATTDTNVYTVPASTQTVISSIVICNRSASSSSFRIAIRPNGATVANQHYIAYDAPISANDIISLTLGITMDAADVVTVYSGSSNLSFSIFGSEVV